MDIGIVVGNFCLLLICAYCFYSMKKISAIERANRILRKKAFRVGNSVYAKRPDLMKELVVHSGFALEESRKLSLQLIDDHPKREALGQIAHLLGNTLQKILGRQELDEARALRRKQQPDFNRKVPSPHIFWMSKQ